MLAASWLQARYLRWMTTTPKARSGSAVPSRWGRALAASRTLPPSAMGTGYGGGAREGAPRIASHSGAGMQHLRQLPRSARRAPHMRALPATFEASRTLVDWRPSTERGAACARLRLGTPVSSGVSVHPLACYGATARSGSPWSSGRMIASLPRVTRYIDLLKPSLSRLVPASNNSRRGPGSVPVIEYIDPFVGHVKVEWAPERIVREH